jgi:F0F1-type ATP synthase assembly protein I
VDAADQSAQDDRDKKGYGDGLTQALTLVVGPVIFGLIGAFIDSMLGTSPLFLIVFGLFGVIAAVVTSIYEYQGRVARHDEGKPWARRMR